MCGISVVINGSINDVCQMGEAIKHRGKYSNCTVIDNVKVVYNYLPITDLSYDGTPFKSGKYTVWLNGYISNYKELATKYSIELNTNCDSELLAKFIDKTGFNVLNQLNGFFAVVVYDDEKVTCFTDRYGIKQLYKYEEKGTTYICSEIKGIRAVLPLKISQSGIEDWYYSLGVMNENSIYERVTRIECLPFKKPFKIEISYEEAKERLSFLLTKSIERNKTDLSCGVFLSGGVDSGVIAKLIKPDYCFSMDYEDEDFSESENIKLNSQAIHLSMICNRHLYSEYISDTVDILDDPKAGSSYTNVALTELASKFCTVMYSGAGGDELFNGYTHRYNRTVDQVINRCGNTEKHFDISHKEYDWKFLRAILVVEDRIGSAYTMETRYPFLDNDLVDFVLCLPDTYLENKQILKDISGLDKKVIEGKKKGFSNPYIRNEDWVKFW